jgi:hypothetical protein
MSAGAGDGQATKESADGSGLLPAGVGDADAGEGPDEVAELRSLLQGVMRSVQGLDSMMGSMLQRAEDR